MNRTIRVRECEKGRHPGVAFIRVHSPAMRHRSGLEKSGARAGNRKYAVIRSIGKSRQVSAAAVRR